MKKTILLLASLVTMMVLVSGVALAAPKKNSGGNTESTQSATITFIYNGEMVTATVHEGSSGNDTITGTPGHDYIKGHDGDDVISGEASSDVLDGGSGNDELKAADGAKDLVYCGTGVDTVEADSADVLYDCETVTYPSS